MNNLRGPSKTSQIEFADNFFKWSNEFSVFSNKQRFHSVQTIHIKQPRTKFQISYLYFPSQYLQQNSKLETEISKTYWSPKIWNIFTHKACATSKWRRWSIDSPMQWHIHRFTKGKPLLMRLSNVRVQHKVAVAKKKATLLRTILSKYPSMEIWG